MRCYLEITRNTVSGILRSKVLYVVAFLAIIIVAFSILPFLVFQMASDAGEADMVTSLQAQSVGNIFNLWTTAAYALALFLGATLISAEVKQKTIVTVLAKPIARWKFLLAKWFGMVGFLLLFSAFGIVIVGIVIMAFDAHVSTLFWAGVGRSFLTITILGTGTMALSTVASPVFSGGFPILLSILSGLAMMSANDPSPVVRTIATGFFLLMPAPMPGNLLAQGFASEPLDPEWGLIAQVMLENGMYILVLLALACMLFSSRELRLK